MLYILFDQVRVLIVCISYRQMRSTYVNIYFCIALEACLWIYICILVIVKAVFSEENYAPPTAILVGKHAY